MFVYFGQNHGTYPLAWYAGMITLFVFGSPTWKYLIKALLLLLQVHVYNKNVSDELWDTMPGFRTSVQKLFSYVLILVFAQGDPSCSLCYILIRLISLWTCYELQKNLMPKRNAATYWGLIRIVLIVSKDVSFWSPSNVQTIPVLTCAG